MFLDEATVFDAPSDASAVKAPSSASVAIIFKYALKVWAREQGVAEADLPELVNRVTAFAGSAISDACS